MKQAAIPDNETERLRALYRYEILDTPIEPRFDALTRVAASILNVPIALISLVDSKRQWFKSRCGLDAIEIPRDVSFCAHVVANGKPLIVADASSDEQFADNPLVAGAPHIRFYVGIPLRTSDGFVLGTFCAIAREPREPTEAQLQALEILADQVMEILELQRRYSQRDRELRDFVENSTVPLRPMTADGVVLWANRAEYELFFTIAIDLLCTVDSNFLFMEVNPAWEAVLGWKRDELRGKSVFELLHPDDAEVARRIAAQILAESGNVANVENRYRHKNGHWVTLAWAAAARHGVFYCAARDMTRYLETAALRRASETRLKAIIDTAVDAILTADTRGMIERVNPAVERIFGYAPLELVGKNISMLMPQSDRHHHDPYVAEYVRTRQPKVIGRGREVTAQRKDGSEFPAELAVSEMIVEGQRMFTGIIRDVSYRKQIERDLRQFKTTLDQTNDAIFIFDPENFRFVYVNQGAVIHLGYSAAELLQMTPLALRPHDAKEEFQKNLVPLLAGELSVCTFETQHRHKNGHNIPVEVVLQYMAPAGEPPRFIKIVRDISERKRIDKQKSEFVSVVSHELRTPLTSLRGALGLVANGVAGELPPLAQEYVDIALSNSDRLMRLVNDILDIEKIQSGSLSFQRQEVELAAVIRQALIANQPYASLHSVTLVFTAEVVGSVVSADEDRLMQVLANLISNAAKFSPAGERVELSMVANDEQIRVSVTDHGSGIAEEFRGRIFQRFAQADSSDTRKKGGTVLGLSISKALIEGMGGTIGFESVPGRGCTFFFELRRHQTVL